MEEEQKVTFKSCRGSGNLPIPKMKMKINKGKASSHNAYYVPLSDTHQCRQWHYSPSSSSPSSSSSSPTTSDQPQWSMSALMAALPESASYKSELYSVPRNQSCNDNNTSTCFSDIDEWLEHANKFCKQPNFQTHSHLVETDNSHRNKNPHDKLSLSPVRKSFPMPSLYNMTLPSIREENPEYRVQREPCDAYLNGVKREKLEAKRDARKKAKHAKLIERMRKKEAAINDWELQQILKAMEEVEKVQDNLERKQLMVSAKTHKKLCLVKEKAEMQKVSLRLSTMKRIHKLQSAQT